MPNLEMQPHVELRNLIPGKLPFSERICDYYSFILHDDPGARKEAPERTCSSDPEEEDCQKAGESISENVDRPPRQRI
jgi:hypothetical protein